MEHLVHDMGDVLRRLELDLPGPVQEVGACELADIENLRVVVGRRIHRLGDGEDEEARRVRVHQRLADVVLDRRVVGDAQSDVDVPLARRVPLRDVDRAERDAVPHRRGADEEPGVDGLVVRRRAVADGADDLLARDLDVRDLERAGLVPAEPERVPERGLRLGLLAVDDEHGEVVVAGEVRARRLHDVEVREAGRGRPRRLLAHLEPTVHALGAGRDRVPEVRPGLRVGVREGPDLPRVERPDIALDQLVGGAEHDRVHGPDVHHVTHRRGCAPVARDRLAGHRVGDMVLAEAAVLLRHGEREEAVLAEQLEVAAREQQLVVGALRVRAHLLLAELDQRRAELLLAVGQDPVRIPLVAEPPERLSSPHLLGHAHLHRIGVLAVHPRQRRRVAARS